MTWRTGLLCLTFRALRQLRSTCRFGFDRVLQMVVETLDNLSLLDLCKVAVSLLNYNRISTLQRLRNRGLQWEGN
jgi:hypothetical protein